MNASNERPAGPSHGQAAAPSPPEPEAPFGGEVRLAQGAAPPLLRWFNYAMYLAAIAYLVVFWADTGYHPIVIVFAGLLSAWLVYVFVAKKPVEP